MITATAFFNLILYLRNKHPDWRYGQTMYNAAIIISGDSESFAGILVDPFYNDDLALEFFALLVEKGIVIL